MVLLESQYCDMPIARVPKLTHDSKLENMLVLYKAYSTPYFRELVDRQLFLDLLNGTIENLRELAITSLVFRNSIAMLMEIYLQLRYAE